MFDPKYDQQVKYTLENMRTIKWLGIRSHKFIHFSTLDWYLHHIIDNFLTYLYKHLSSSPDTALVESILRALASLTIFKKKKKKKLEHTSEYNIFYNLRSVDY